MRVPENVYLKNPRLWPWEFLKKYIYKFTFFELGVLEKIVALKVL